MSIGIYTHEWAKRVPFELAKIGNVVERHEVGDLIVRHHDPQPLMQRSAKLTVGRHRTLDTGHRNTVPMNLILLTQAELDAGLEDTDERVIHIREILKCGPDNWFDIGIINGPRGKARMTLSDDGRAVFDYSVGDEPPDLFPITLIVGMPRPQTARRLLREMTSMGVERIWFAMTDRSEKGYASSKLWTTGEYKRHVKQGAEQAFCTRLPDIQRFDSLTEAIGNLSSGGGRAALDNYEAAIPLSKWAPTGSESVLAIGAERGWSATERDQLRATGFELVHLGDRVLRVETAAIAATTILLSNRGAL